MPTGNSSVRVSAHFSAKPSASPVSAPAKTSDRTSRTHKRIRALPSRSTYGIGLWRQNSRNSSTLTSCRNLPTHDSSSSPGYHVRKIRGHMKNPPPHPSVMHQRDVSTDDPMLVLKSPAGRSPLSNHVKHARASFTACDSPAASTRYSAPPTGPRAHVLSHPPVVVRQTHLQRRNSHSLQQCTAAAVHATSHSSSANQHRGPIFFP